MQLSEHVNLEPIKYKLIRKRTFDLSSTTKIRNGFLVLNVGQLQAPDATIKDLNSVVIMMPTMNMTSKITDLTINPVIRKV